MKTVRMVSVQREGKMGNYEKMVFISYAWGGEREEIVDQIERALQERGLTIIRDRRELGYKGSIREFMERIGQGNCVIVVISDKYLRSPNCMFELVEIAENKQFSDRIFPVVLADAEIYDPIKRLGYVKYWEDQRNALAEAMKAVDPANLQGIRDDMDMYHRIRDQISGLASTLKDMNALTPEMHRDSNFSHLYDAIEKRMKESQAAPNTDAEADARTNQSADSRPTGEVTARKSSTAIGNIQIGGDLSGNLVIGNNNSVNESHKADKPKR
jgi:hypothetical protein